MWLLESSSRSFCRMFGSSWDIRPRRRRNAERADAGHPARPSKPTSREGRAPSLPGTSAATVRRFAWAPADGASGYRFELFRGSSRIFTAETSRARASASCELAYRGREADVKRRRVPLVRLAARGRSALVPGDRASESRQFLPADDLARHRFEASQDPLSGGKSLRPTCLAPLAHRGVLTHSGV